MPGLTPVFKKSGVFFLMSLDLTKEKFQIPCHGLQDPAWPDSCFPLYLHDPLDTLSLTTHPPHLPPPILNPAKRLAVLRFCTPVLISKVSPELDSSLVQKPGKFSHFHQLLQNSQGVHVTLFTFTTVMSMLSSASFSRYSECTFSTSAGFPNTSWSLYEQPRCSFDSSASFISIANQRTSSNKFAFWIVLKYNLSSFLIGLMVISHLDYPQSMPIGLCQLSLTSLTHPPTYSFICLSTHPFNPLILSAIHSHTHSSFDLSTYPSIHSSILPEYLFCTRWGK